VNIHSFKAAKVTIIFNGNEIKGNIFGIEEQIRDT